jgi:hypothetical protein
MKLFKTTYKRIVAGLFTLILASGVISCNGGSSSGSSGSSSLSISSLSDIPELSNMVDNTSTSASISYALMAVSGDAPSLNTIDSDDAETLFWDGLISDVITNGADAEDIDAYWQGEGKCRMAQNVGFAFRHIEESGTSVCYLKNAPEAESGVEITSGDATVDNIFSPDTETKLVQVNVSNANFGGEEEEGAPNEQNIFIQVYGTSTSEASDGFAIDLWFCAEGEDTPNSYEQVRVNESTGVMTQLHANVDGNGTFTSDFTGTLAINANGSVSFDPDSTQTAEVFFQGSSEDFKGRVQIIDGEMISKSWSTYEDSEYDFSEERKVYVNSTYSGTSTDDLKFLSAGFAAQWSNSDFEESGSDAFSAATEFQDTTYATLLSGDLFDSVNNFDFADDSFWDGTLAIDSDLVSARTSYDCNATPDIVVSMDMSDSGMQAVQTLCETAFDGNMDFCDSADINEARNAIFDAEFSEE